MRKSLLFTFASSLLFASISIPAAGSEVRDLAVEPADLTIVGDFVTGAVGFGEGLGHSVAASDFNGDGRDDLLLGASGPLGLSGSSNATYVIFGSDTPGGFLDLALADADFTVLAEVNDDDDLGRNVTAADINDDDFDDVIVGANDAVYVFFGSPGLGGTVDLASSDADLTILGAELPVAGDINGDDIADLVLSDSGADAPGRGFAGKVFVVFGASTLSGTIDLDMTADLTVLGERIEDFLHSRGVGDINGDGTGDLILSATAIEGAKRFSGEVLAIFGSTTIGGTIDLATDAADLTIQGANEGDVLHSWGAKDVNDDGIDDLLMGAPGQSVDNAGGAHVVFGARSLGGIIDLSSVDPDVSILGAGAFDFLGTTFSAADLSGDGINDLILGAWGSDQKGLVYVIHSSAMLGGSIDLATTPADITVLGVDAMDLMGVALPPAEPGGSTLAAGDFDGNGRNDLLLGAFRADGVANAKDSAGEAYVLLFGIAGPGGSVTGLRSPQALCVNVNTGQRVRVRRMTAWNCEEQGLVTATGDHIRQITTGRADGSAPAGGSVSGMTDVTAQCRNLATGQAVSIPLNGTSSWDCEAAGLSVEHGDRIRQVISGIAD